MFMLAADPEVIINVVIARILLIMPDHQGLKLSWVSLHYSLTFLPTRRVVIDLRPQRAEKLGIGLLMSKRPFGIREVVT